jgi:hypothetical protein
MDDHAAFVQFPHPGDEHNPPTDDMAWNLGNHRRKFLRSAGRIVAGDDRPAACDVVFWGEWEAPSRVERRWPADGRLPRALHRPYWFRPGPDKPRQNTDPWVFGEQMLYSNCRQRTGRPPHRVATAMQSLPAGSVICFGSTIDGEFCLDTVFVVASAQPWTPAETAELDVDDGFKVCTAESIAAAGSDAHAGLTLYRGASFAHPVNGTYSFVPALPVTGNDVPRFARPAVHLPELINPASMQSTQGSPELMSFAALREAWAGVREQVLGAGLGLAVGLDTPPERDTGQPIPVVSAPACRGCG